MRILIVEDEQADIQDLQESLAIIGYSGQADVARSRDSALACLNQHDYDLIVCDIRIPTVDGGLDIAEEHGFFVHSEARRIAPGVPQLFLTGQATPRNIKERLGRGGTGEAFGCPDWIMVQLAEKDDPSDCESILSEAVAGFNSSLDSVAIESSDELSPRFQAAVRTFALRQGASRCQVAVRLGLSGAEVARVTLTDDAGSQVGSAFLKVLPAEEAAQEMERYESFAPPLLAPGLFAPAMRPISTGLGRCGALLFTVADASSHDLFEVAAASPPSAAASVATLFTGMLPWSERLDSDGTTLRDLRRRFVSDEILAAKGQDVFFAHEEVELTLSQCVSHGDLHGQNILVSGDGRPMLIDFADTGLHPRAADPVVLELSFVFHRDRPRVEDWPTVDHCQNWSDVERFAEDSPFGDLLRICRREAFRRASETETAVMAYCHSLRQLKYPDVDPRAAAAVATSALERILE